jgi:protein O-mannosyl-transferase
VLDPKLAERNLQAGRALASQGQSESAAARFLTAAFLNPLDPDCRTELGTLLAQEGKLAQAEAQFQQAADLEPTADVFRNLGLAQLLQGRPKDAVSNYRKGLELKPDWPILLNDLAWVLATSPDPTVRNGEQAVQLANKACELSGGKEARYLGTLDAALAEAGRFEEAIASAKKARELALTAGQKDLAAAAEERREFYNRKQPFRSK